MEYGCNFFYNKRHEIGKASFWNYESISTKFQAIHLKLCPLSHNVYTWNYESISTEFQAINLKLCALSHNAYSKYVTKLVWHSKLIIFINFEHNTRPLSPSFSKNGKDLSLHNQKTYRNFLQEKRRNMFFVLLIHEFQGSVFFYFFQEMQVVLQVDFKSSFI